MKKINKVKALFCIVISAIMLLSSNVNAMAAPVTKIKIINSTTKKQYTNIYAMHTSFEVPSGILFWKKDTYFLDAKFNSAKQIMVKDITGGFFGKVHQVKS